MQGRHCNFYNTQRINGSRTHLFCTRQGEVCHRRRFRLLFCPSPSPFFSRFIPLRDPPKPRRPRHTRSRSYPRLRHLRQTLCLLCPPLPVSRQILRRLCLRLRLLRQTLCLLCPPLPGCRQTLRRLCLRLRLLRQTFCRLCLCHQELRQTFCRLYNALYR